MDSSVIVKKMTSTSSHKLPGSEGDLVNPCAVSVHGIVSVHLESDIELIHGRCDRRVRPVYVMRNAVISKTHEDRICGCSLKFPDQVVPCESGGDGAGNTCALPGGATPDVPHAAISDIALGSEDKLVRAVGLIRVKLQGLSGIRVRQIEKDLIFEILGSIVRA